MYCRYCGKQIKDEDEYCIYCGARTNSIPTIAIANKPIGTRTKGSFSIYLFVTIIWLLASIVLFAARLTSPNSHSSIGFGIEHTSWIDVIALPTLLGIFSLVMIIDSIRFNKIYSREGNSLGRTNSIIGLVCSVLATMFLLITVILCL